MKDRCANLMLPALLLLFFIQVKSQKVVRYDLFVKDTLVDFTGKKRKAIAVNGQIPMPTLTFTQGDTAEIWVHNERNECTALHWHGLILPNQEDGVPYLTQMPIKPHSTYMYRFPIVQNGTHWYHSHFELQEQLGMYGSFIMLKKNDAPSLRSEFDALPAIPVMLSEWTDYRPENIHRMLHNASDWFAIRKNTTQSYAEAIRAGHFKTKLVNEWKRMLAMDVSDVYYDRVLINGSRENQLSSFRPGEKVRLRVSNGGASTNFWLKWGPGSFTVIASDGNDVEPVVVDRLLIAVSETYDIIVQLPDSGGFASEFVATAEDRIQSAALFLGGGIRKLADPLPGLQYFEGMKMMNDMMKMNGDLDDMGMNMSLNQMDMNAVMYPEISGAVPDKKNEKSSQQKHGSVHSAQDKYDPNAISDIKTLNYAMLVSPENTELPANSPVKEFKFELTGNMNRYVWSLDNKVLSEADRVLIRKGEIVRIIMFNNSMMRHPMHLHGHDFRLINGHGQNAPMKNVIDIMPMETDTIEFYADQEGDWFFHCHILYHMMSGMGRVFRYEDNPGSPLIKHPAAARRKLFSDDRAFHLMAENDFATNGNDGELMIQNTRWSFGTEWRLGYHDHHGYETETHVGRYIGKMQWLMPFIGFDWRYRKEGFDKKETNLFGQSNTKDLRNFFSLGMNYTLPMLVIAQAEVFTDGYVRFQLMREDIPLAKRLRAAFMVNTDREYMLGIRYIVNRYIGLRVHYDSDMGFGAGLALNY